MNQNINDMIDSVLNGNKEDFSSSFKSEIHNRIDSTLIDKRLNTAKDILNTEESPTEEDNIEEGKTISSQYKFKNKKDALIFIKAVKESGIRENNIKLSNKDVTVMKIDPNMIEILDFLAKDMKAIRK